MTSIMTQPEIMEARERRSDGWMNVFTGMGDPFRDKRLGTQITNARLYSQAELDALYHSDDIIARVCDRPADEMCREGFKLATDLDADAAADALNKVDELDVMAHFADAIAFSRLHGGSVAVLGINDGADASMPVSPKSISSVDWVNVLDRWEIQIERVYTDPRLGKLGEPQYYRLLSTTITDLSGQPFGTIIHESRVIRFGGMRTGRRERIRNQHWDRSIVERIADIVRDFGASFQAVSVLPQEFVQASFSVEGLANMIANDKDDLVMKRLQIFNMAKSVFGMVPLDTNEKMQRESITVTGLADLLDRLAERLSAATEMPISLLMGRAPAGLNATGDSDISNWYDSLKNQQKRTLLRPCNKIMKYIFLSKKGPTSGVEPDNWSIEFNPLWQMNESQKADIRSKQALTDQIYIVNQVLQPQEVRQSRFGGDCWSAETVIDPAYDEAADAMDKESEKLAGGDNPDDGKNPADDNGDTGDGTDVARGEAE